MTKICISFVVSLLIAFPLKAQDATKPFYFPHKKGDMWEYFYYDGPRSVDTLQNFTICDSTGSNGIIFIKQHARAINPIGPSYFFYPDTTKLWIDTVNNYVWGPKDEGDSSLIYRLDANKGDQWVAWNYAQIGGTDYLMAKVTDKWKGVLFDKKTTFINISYYVARDSTDSTGTGIIELGSDEIADGFGLISRGGGDISGEIHLIGVVINDTLYGDTTKVTGVSRDDLPVLPEQITLFQNYPNPFNPNTTISFKISQTSNVSLVVYDLLGRKINRLIDNRHYASGTYQIVWNGKDQFGFPVSSGMYLYRLVASDKTITRKMLLIK